MIGVAFLVFTFASVQCKHVYQVSAGNDVYQVSAGNGFPKGEAHYCRHEDDYCYYVSEAGQYTYKQAEEICHSLTKTGSGFYTLPMPKDYRANLEASKLAKGDQYWLGIGNKYNKDDWHYDTPADRLSPLRFSNFYKKQKYPEPNGGRRGLCAFSTATGAWFDSFCTTTQPRVVCGRKFFHPLPDKLHLHPHNSNRPQLSAFEPLLVTSHPSSSPEDTSHEIEDSGSISRRVEYDSHGLSRGKRFLHTLM